MADVGVDLRRIRPVRFRGDDVEAVPLDQPPGDRRPSAVELAGAMAGLADEDHAGVGEALEGVGKMGVFRGWQGDGVTPEAVDDLVFGRGCGA